MPHSANIPCITAAVQLLPTQIKQRHVNINKTHTTTCLQESSALSFLQYPFAALIKSTAIALIYFLIFLNYYTFDKTQWIDIDASHLDPNFFYYCATQCVSPFLNHAKPYSKLTCKIFTVTTQTSFEPASQYESKIMKLKTYKTLNFTVVTISFINT